MKFTLKNFQTEFPKIQSKASPELQKHYKNAVLLAPKYDKIHAVKQAIDKFLQVVNHYYGDKTPAPAAKSSGVLHTPQKEKAPKTAKEKPQYQGSYVEKILPEVSFIKRFAVFHDKPHRDIKERARALLASLQKAIVEKQIRKTSQYAAEIMDVQNDLIKIVAMPKSGIPINIKSVERYKEIGASQRVSDSTSLIKAFLAIQGKEGVKEKAEALLKRVNEGINNATFDRGIIQHSLQHYINGKTPTPEVSAHTLQGLYGLAGIEVPQAKSGQTMSANQFLGSTFKTVNLTGKWASFIGFPNHNFKIMLYGKAGSGKSTFALKFAKYLVENVGKKVLYVAAEEKLSYTLHEKIVRLEITSPNFYIVDKLPSANDLRKYDIIFIDSVNMLGLEPQTLERLPHDLAYCYIFQCTKDGNYRGSQAFEHNADSVIEIAEMKAIMHKNRFGGKLREITI
jgi:hypothetical protein